MLYAKTTRAIPQVVSDVGFFVWVALWVFLANQVRYGVGLYAQAVTDAEANATDLATALKLSTDSLTAVPVVGDLLAASLAPTADSLAGLPATLHEVSQLLEATAVVLAVIAFVIPVVVYVCLWLPRRVAFVREASAGKHLAAAESSPELFALRAIAHAPLRDLLAVTPDPMGAWKRGDPTVIRQLSRLELARHGVKPRT
ncbi:MAG: hypothetical protein LBI33_03115 [Propionibacteriaceae bacterium]|jgi:hypothetical protein|nr:hypothetical protein [Propionibacteriaceae bacterium]